ncbi:MAG TPA: styrene monooxygenase/indole monooxygenase family protein [Blastocatellia bacterium]|nr:styrene monooxygenase/indole monooxygenase family protein [Blastocatellia bacterium]
MKNIGIVGSGIAGLHLALFLQKHGQDATIYSDKSAGRIRDGRLFNLVVRFEPTRERERALGVNHWDFPDYGVSGVHMYIGSQPPISWKGSVKRPASAVDMRIYQSTLLQDFEKRGGKVVIGVLEASDIANLSAQHDLMVVASGRNMTEMFARDPDRSPYENPQRRLTGAFVRGVDFPEALRVNYTISPGIGEIFQAPFTTFEGNLCSILIEAIPGQAFDHISDMRYDDDPKRFESTFVELLREHAPPIYERVNPKEFGVTRPLDVIQGAITPTVRRGYAPLGKGKFAMALGDVHMLHDPIIAQGANNASKCAWILGEALIEASRMDEEFCSDTERLLWEASRASMEWTNATLQPPPPHAVELFVAATQNKQIADELTNNFGSPEKNWEIFGSPAGAAAFLARHQVH